MFSPQGDRRLVRSTGMVSRPLPADITNNLRNITQTQYSSEYVDHFYAVYRTRGPQPSESWVVMKYYRVFGQAPNLQNQTQLQDLRRDIYQWKTLSHPNVLPFLGTSNSVYPCFVLPLKQYGHVSRFLNEHPEADRLALIRGIASGLKYLHTRSPPIFHGRLKDTNILIDDGYQPLLADFGLSGLEEVYETFGSSIAHAASNIRWLAPECLDPASSFNSWKTDRRLPADIWAFGMVTHTILSGHVPFERIRSPYAIAEEITAGRCPLIPVQWDQFFGGRGGLIVLLIRQCWDRDPKKRPTLHRLLLSV